MTARKPAAKAKPTTPPKRGVAASAKAIQPKVARIAASVVKTPEFPWPLRPYQQQALDAFDEGKRRQLLVWHRRAGKDLFSMSLARREADRNIGAYWHFFPKHSQAKRALWNGVDPKRGKRFIDIAFGDRVKSRNNTDMFLEMNNGSTWQLLGSDNYDRIVGGNARGVVFSEWALCDPRAWDFMRPIIRENGGWAVFITTYRGRNHAWRMAQDLATNPDWYVDIRTVEDTSDLKGNRIITDADIERERADGMDESLIQQEYYCSPAAGLTGATYARQALKIQQTPARQVALWNPSDPVVCAWNLVNFPVTVSLVISQPGDAGRYNRVLAAQTLDFTTLAECAAWVREHPYPIQHHVIHVEDAEYLQPLADLRVYAEPLTTTQGEAEAITQSWLEQTNIDFDNCPTLADALLGYTRTEKKSATDGTQMFSDDYDYSWHAYQTNALELCAAWQYHRGGSWSRNPDYRVSDLRRRKT